MITFVSSIEISVVTVSLVLLSAVFPLATTRQVHLVIVGMSFQRNLLAYEQIVDCLEGTTDLKLHVEQEEVSDLCSIW